MSFTVDFNSDAVMAMVNDAVGEALDGIAADLKKTSEALCPKQRGYDGGLVSTASVEVDKENLSVTMKYGAPHSHLVHDKVEWKHAPGTHAKFLEQPILENGPRYMDEVNEKLVKKIGR